MANSFWPFEPETGVQIPVRPWFEVPESPLARDAGLWNQSSWVRFPPGRFRYFYIIVVESLSMEKSIRVELPNGEVWKIQRKVAAKLLAQKISSSSDTDSQAIKLLYLNNPEETAKDLTLLDWDTFEIHAERVSEPGKDYESLWLQAETEVEE